MKEWIYENRDADIGAQAMSDAQGVVRDYGKDEALIYAILVTGLRIAEAIRSTTAKE